MARKLPRTAVPHSLRPDIVEWLRSPQIDAGFLVPHLKYSVAFTDLFGPGVETIISERAEGGEHSWFGGPAIAPLDEWPRTVDGEPLAHIATLFLPSVDAAKDVEDSDLSIWPEPGARLPSTGYLEIFHHLQTYGNPEDADSRGWLVRHVPAGHDDPFPALIEPPADTDTPTEVCQAVWESGTFSVPRAGDFTGADDRTFSIVENVETELFAAWEFQRTAGAKVTAPVFPFTHLYGHSDAGTTYAHEILREVRPLVEDGDSYTLLLSIDGWNTFDEWFGDAGNFEVWMRESDLRDRRFDEAWCMIRTD